MSLLAGTTAGTAVLQSVPARNEFLAHKDKGCPPEPGARCACQGRCGRDRNRCPGSATQRLGRAREKMIKFWSPTTREGKRRENAHCCLLDTVCQAQLLFFYRRTHLQSAPRSLGAREPPGSVSVPPQAQGSHLAALMRANKSRLANKRTPHLSLQRDF